MFDSWLQDARYAFRLLRKSPVFTATAALSLAIGIGANATIFSIASALLLRPLPGLAEPDRLVDVGRTQDGSGFDTISYPNYLDLRDRAKSLDGLYAYREPQAMSLGGRGEAERIYGSVVTANYFTVLGTKPAAGRLLQASDDRGDAGVAVLGYELWQRRFASDPSIVGRTIPLNGHPFVIVGVAERGFQGTTLLRPDLWVPMAALRDAMPRLGASITTQRRAVWLHMGGRLAPGVTGAQATAELASIGAALEREFPEDNRGKNYRVAASALVPGQIDVVAAFLAVLTAIVGLVLLIACANVAGMLLARAAERRREMAVRVAIGAGRGRLIRQLLTETALLFGAGGFLALLLTKWLTMVLLSVLPQLPVPVSLDMSTDWRVVGFGALVSLLAAVLSGLAPALQASRADLVPALKAEGLSRGPARLRLRNAFVVGQITMSLMLVIAAGLFLRSLQRAADIQPGFDERRVDVVSFDLSLAGYTDETGGPFMRELIARASALPGVESASATVDLPLDGGRMSRGGLKGPGMTLPTGQQFFGADWNIVEPGFFATLKLPLLRGRDFSPADARTSPSVAIVNEAFAKRAWPGDDPIGKRMQVEGDPADAFLTVIGVAKDAQLMSLGDAAKPYLYVPYAQRSSTRVSLLVRTAGDASAIPQIRDLVRQLNANLPVTQAMALSQVTAIGLVPQRIAAAVAGSLGVVALLLATIGIYGVTSYAVSRRTREIGIRMALGANNSSVIALVVRQGFVLAAIGVAIGSMIAAAGSRLLESLLFGVRGLDPVTFGGACLLFAVCTLAASYIPARRATAVDPMAALRNE